MVEPASQVRGWTGRAYELAGVRFGELTVVERAPDTLGRNVGRLWLCMCDCGRQAIRSSSALMWSRREGIQNCCQQCLDELSAGRRHQFHDQLRTWYREQWKMIGDLWAPSQTQRLERRIREDMAREMGFEPAIELTTELRGAKQRADGAHEPFAATLDDVGAELGVSRERVRQIEAQALRRLRHYSRSKHLKSFVAEGGAQHEDRCVALCLPTTTTGTPGADVFVRRMVRARDEAKESKRQQGRRLEVRRRFGFDLHADWWPIDVEAAKRRHAAWLEERDMLPPPSKHRWLDWLSGPGEVRAPSSHQSERPPPSSARPAPGAAPLPPEPKPKRGRQIPRMSAPELRTFVNAVKRGEIFSTAHLPPGSSVGLERAVFAPLALGLAAVVSRERVYEVGIVWEYVERGEVIPGAPYRHFGTMRLMHCDDWRQIREEVIGHFIDIRWRHPSEPMPKPRWLGEFALRLRLTPSDGRWKVWVNQGGPKDRWAVALGSGQEQTTELYGRLLVHAAEGRGVAALVLTDGNNDVVEYHGRVVGRE